MRGARRGGCEGCTNWSDLASDDGGGVGGLGQGGGQGGGRCGGGPQNSVGTTRRALVHLLGSLKNRTIGLLAGDEGGRRRQQRAVWEQQLV